MQNNENNGISGSGSGPIQFDEKEELLDIRYDNIFKAVFTKETPSSKGALSGLISALIERKIVVQTIIANELPLDNVFNRSIRFDIACKAESGELINIEMTFNPFPYEPARLEYYLSRQFSGQDIKGITKNYTDLKETYQITIVGKKRIFPDETLVHTFQHYDHLHHTVLNGKTRIITMELLKAEKIVYKPTYEMGSQEAWAVFFQYLTDISKRAILNEILKKEAEIEMAGETLIEISRDEIEQARLTSELKYILDNQSMMTDARREGREEGFEKGREEERQRFLDLLNQGLSVEEIKQRL